MPGLNLVDGYIIVLVLISVLIGIYRGFLREFLTIITLIIASTVAYLFGKQAGQIFTFLESELFKELSGMLAIFIALFILGFLIKIIIFKIFKITSPSPLDRFTGALFGFVRGMAVIVAVLIMVNQTIMAQDWYKKSTMIPYISAVADTVVKLTPETWKKDLQQQMQQINTQEMGLMQKMIERNKVAPVEYPSPNFSKKEPSKNSEDQ